MSWLKFLKMYWDLWFFTEAFNKIENKEIPETNKLLFVQKYYSLLLAAVNVVIWLTGEYHDKDISLVSSLATLGLWITVPVIIVFSSEKTMNLKNDQVRSMFIYEYVYFYAPSLFIFNFLIGMIRNFELINIGAISGYVITASSFLVLNYFFLKHLSNRYQVNLRTVRNFLALFAVSFLLSDVLNILYGATFPQSQYVVLGIAALYFLYGFHLFLKKLLSFSFSK